MEIWVRPFPARGGRYQVSKEGGEQPIWSRDGRQLFYRERSEPLQSLNQAWVVDVRTEGVFSASKPRLLFERRGFVRSTPIRGWDLWPDGRGFIMATSDNRKAQPVTELILIQNWFEELKRLAPTR